MKTTKWNEIKNAQPGVTVRAAGARGETNLGWLQSRHTFSFGGYFDPDQMGYRSLRVINDDVVQAGGGFGEHPHRDAEIFSYVIEGELEHKDSLGNGRIVKAGDLQYISAGRGVMHSEFNPSGKKAVHFLQIWLRPRMGGGEPRYAEKALGKDAPANALTLLFAGEENAGAGAVEIRADARIYFGKLEAGKSLLQPLAPGRGAWVQVIQGELAVNGTELKPGDGAAVEGAAAVELAASLALEPSSRAEFLLFDLA